MTRISYIFQDMKCQYIYDAIDHYSYSNEINGKKRRTKERVIFMRMLDYYFEKRAVNILSHIEKKKKSNQTMYVLLLTNGLMMGAYIYMKKELSSH